MKEFQVQLEAKLYSLVTEMKSLGQGYGITEAKALWQYLSQLQDRLVDFQDIDSVVTTDNLLVIQHAQEVSEFFSHLLKSLRQDGVLVYETASSIPLIPA